MLLRFGYVSTPRPTLSRVTTVDGRSPGSRIAILRRLPRTRDPSGTNDKEFTAYSCGGSYGIETNLAPHSHLIPEKGNRRVHRIGVVDAVSMQALVVWSRN
jgi:hypothetical protein